MEEHFNKLTPPELEALSILAEECGETVQRVGKILRHGLDSFQPKTTVGNVQALEEELGDICAAMELVGLMGIVDIGRIRDRMRWKLERYGSGKYVHHIKLAEDDVEDGASDTPRVP